MSHRNSVETRRGSLIAFLLLLSLLSFPALVPAATTDNQGSLRITKSGSEVRIFGADSRLAHGLDLGYVPSFVAVHESANLLYSSDSLGRTLFVHDLSTGALLRQVDLGGKAVAAAFDAQRAQLFVLDQANAKVRALDATSLKTRAEARVGGTPIDLALDASNGTLFVASSGKRLVEISADTLRVSRRVRDLDEDAVALHVSHAADLLIVQHEKWVSVYRLSNLKFRDYLPLEGHPQRIQVDPAGTKIYVQLKDETDNVAVFDTASLHADSWVNVAGREFNGRKVDASSFTVDQAGNLVFYDAGSKAFFGKQDTMFVSKTPSAPDTFPAGVTPGPDIQVNPTIDKGAQTVPNAGFDGYGNFAITWSDGAGNDGNGEGVFMRKFLANQTPVATEFRVNKFKAGDQGTSSLTCADSGQIMVIWRDASGRDGDSFGVYGRIVNPDGTFLTDDFLIPQTTAGRQMAPSVTGTPNGNFVAAWSGPGDGSGRGTWFRLFDATGTPLTNELLANTSVVGNTWAVNVSQNRNGDFVVVWRDDSNDRIRGRAWHADGTPVAGADFQAGPMVPASHDFESGVTVFDDATFVVIWRETAAGGIVAQRFNADQTTNGQPFVVSSKATGQQFGPAIAGAPDGQFVVTWRDSDYPTDDIVARLFMADGSPNGDDFIVPDTLRAGDEFECTAAMDDAGNFVVAYKDRGGPTSIAARYFMQAPPPSPMQITSATPATANIGDTLDVALAGNGFTSDAVVSFPDDANIIVNSTTFVDGNNLTANITIGPLTFLGLHNVKVTTGTASTTKKNLFAVKLAGIYPQATVLSVVPGSASQHESTNVTITGTNFVNEPANLLVDFGSDITVSKVAWVNSTTLTADITVAASAVIGLRDVNVTNPGAAAGTCTQCFNVLFDPTLYSDDFSDGDASDWTASGGTWTVFNGALQGQTSGKATIVSPFTGCSVCSFEADIKRGPNASAYVSLLGWYVDKKNLVELRLDKDKQRWLLKQKVNGDVVAKAHVSAALTTGVFYHVQLAFDGTQFTVTVDGSPLITLPVGLGTTPNGTVAFRANGTIGTLDNVKVLP